MKNNKIIYGIQQIGIGVKDADKTFDWYSKRLGFDIPIIEDNNEATLMSRYMGNSPRQKRAILAINLQGGAGCEFWQYTEREPQSSKNIFQLGDLGINSIFIKSKNIETTFERLQRNGENIQTEILTEFDRSKYFYLKDPFDNLLKVIESNSWFSRKGGDVGGISGCSIGVSDIDNSLHLYSNILGYDKIIFDKIGTISNLPKFAKSKESYRRILLTSNKKITGGFSPLFGQNYIELIQCLDTTSPPIFQDRFWGDLGFIHLAFDIHNMKDLVNECKNLGFPFKVLSDPTFNMGNSQAQWGYIEDNDGTLIEFVETSKIPILKSLGININMQKRNPSKPIPKWIIKALSIKRIKKE